jgi:hypothetical protein
MGLGAKSYIRKGFPKYEEMRKCSPYMRRPLVIYDFAPDPYEFSLYMRKISFSFLSVWTICFREQKDLKRGTGAAPIISGEGKSCLGIGGSNS